MTEQGSSFFSSHDPAQYSRAECALSRWTVLFAAIAIGLMIGGVHCLWTGAQIREVSAFNTRTAQNYFKAPAHSEAMVRVACGMFACSGSAIALIALFSTPGFRRSSTARDAGARFEEQFAFLSTLTANSACGIVITDAEERTVYVNPVFERISGFSAEEMIGKKPGALLQGAETDAEARNRIRCSLKAGEPISVEILNYQKNGTPYWIEMFISPLFDAEGKITHFVADLHPLSGH